MGVSVRHNSRLAALVALAAAVMTVAWFSRALQTGAVTDWLWCIVVASVGVLQLLVVRDGRAPLLVADELGVRVRRGETWSGLRWQDIENVEVQSPRSWLRDGQIVVHPRVVSVEEALLREAQAEKDGAERPAARSDEAYVVPLARTTRLDFDNMTGDLVSDLDALASGRVPVLVLTQSETQPEIQPETRSETQPGPGTVAEPEHVALMEHLELPEQAEELGEEQTEEQTEEEPERSVPVERLARVKAARGRWARVLARLGAEPTVADQDAPQSREQGLDEAPAQEQEPDRTPEQDLDEDQDRLEFEPVAPGRETRPAARSEVVHEAVRMLPNPPAIPFQRTGEVPAAVVARVDDFAATAPQAVADAVIGPLIAAARGRARLSIDTLSERTRIRPHVLECIEVDDFEACGGDFYARGHLRTLARVFGLDAQQLLDLYDDRYAHAEIEARQVFEAELASGIGGGVRTAYTGPRWSLLAACVLALAGVWGVAKVFNDTPQELVSPAPNVVDSAGLANAKAGGAPKTTLASLEVSAEGNSPQVVVRDRDGRILWAGKLADGQHQQVIGLAPFDVTASDGKAVEVKFLGRSKGSVGETSAAGSKQFG